MRTLATALGEATELATALAELWDIPEETLSYYQSSLSLGGILVSVYAEEARLEGARQLLRKAGVRPLAERSPMWASSPGFTTASKMSETNPIDAPMSGDFRKY